MLKHLVCIMDGNRRWAHKNKTTLSNAYTHGIKAVKRVIQFCTDQNIPYLTLYAFSLENVQRNSNEKKLLFALLVNQEKKLIDYCVAHNVKMQCAGDTAQLPVVIRLVFNRIEAATAHCTDLHMQILFYYGGRQELLHVVTLIAEDLKKGTLSLPFTPETIQDYLWTQSYPDPDLIIRTGGHKRLSNCLLYQSAYSEFCFLDVLWPDMNEAYLFKAYTEFLKSNKNYGK